MPWKDQSGGGGSGGGPGGGSGGEGGGPWGSGPRRPWGQPPRQPQSPQGPDLEEMMRQWGERFRGSFGGGNGSRRGGAGGRGLSWPMVAGALVFGWLLLGVYTVDEGERGVITRLGAYSRTTGPGLHMRVPPPIERLQIVNVTGQRTDEIGFTMQGERLTDNSEESLMITGDRNIVEIHFRIYYNISDAEDFVFNVREPASDPRDPRRQGAVRQLAESAMREVIGRRRLEPIITTERGAVEQEVEDLMQQVLDQYEAGVNVLQVELLSAAAPPAVIEAFNDVVNAGQEAEAMINNANRETSRIVNEAQAYRERVVREATGEAQRFIAVHNEYRASPRVTRDRLYLETMERVYRDADTIILDERGGAVPYLPLENVRRPTAAPRNPQGAN